MGARFYTPAEVADELRLAKSTVYRALEEGRLPGVKVLGRWRVDAEELTAWIDSSKRYYLSGWQYQPDQE